MPSENRVDLQIKHCVAYVRLNRTDKRNAIDMTMFKAVADTIKTLRKNRGIRAVIVSGEGEDFCSGLDVKSVMKNNKNPFKLLFKLNPWGSNLAQQVSVGWQQIPVPVIMVIHGRCWGGGLQIALGGDVRISTPDASLSIMEGRWGLIPDMGGTLALRTLGRMDLTKELAMTAAVIDAPAAQQAGWVTHISEDPMAQAEALATTISQQSPDAVAAVKKLYNRSWQGSSGWVLLRESWYQLRILLGKNFRTKVHNQTHDEDNQRTFQARKKW